MNTRFRVSTRLSDSDTAQQQHGGRSSTWAGMNTKTHHNRWVLVLGFVPNLYARVVVAVFCHAQRKWPPHTFNRRSMSKDRLFVLGVMRGLLPPCRFLFLFLTRRGAYCLVAVFWLVSTRRGGHCLLVSDGFRHNEGATASSLFVFVLR